MPNPILLVTNAGTGTTPIPVDALLKPGDELNIHNSEDSSQRPAKCIAVAPAGVPVEYAIADQTGIARPLMITKPKHREPIYVLEWEGRQFFFTHAKIRKGMERAEKAGLNAMPKGDF
ncbi:hypothetical protein [Mesorhizobium sp. M0520]|uniref:hypothetical protein n=1 Tax=Mesorhizobium sp. M0520 TaxID=2956957 RepID=UPI003337D687